MRCEDGPIHADPDEQDPAKSDEKFPTAAELGDVVGESLAEGEFLFELFAEVTGENLMLLQALDDFLVEGGQFTNFFFQDFFHVIFAEFAQIIQTNKTFVIQARQTLPDEFEQRWPDQLCYHTAVW